jgi:translation initiation factor 1A
MPNRTGGKNYKKSKQTGTQTKPFIERQEDQMYARVLRNLGGRNMLTYCNDGKVRLCHICGGMKKFDWLQVGDLVLISLRDFGHKQEAGSQKYERGDILAKYERDHIHQLKKLPDINKNLFLALETVDGTKLAELGGKDNIEDLLPDNDDEGGIIFEHDDKEDKKEKEEESSDEDKDINIDDI